MKRFLLYSIILIATIMSVSAAERVVEHRVVVDIPFHLAGGDKDDIRYDIDSVALARSIYDLQLLAKDLTTVVKRVEIYGSVSPEGTVRKNKELCKERIATAEGLVRECLKLDESIVVTYDDRYIPWHSYLLPAITADKDVPYRDELLKLVYRPADAKGRDHRRVMLKRSHGGKLWRVVEERYFDHMRKGGAIITVERRLNGDILSACDIFNGGVEPVLLGDISIEPIKVEEKAQATESVVLQSEAPRHAISIKTNAAAVVALITNIGFEVKLAPRWSLDVMGAYSPYNMVVKDRKIRLFGIRPEARFWWGEPMKRGHFIGLHGFTSAFNVQLNDKVRLQDPNHALWGVGLAYGYALPLGKKEHWGVEFTLGLGYARIKYDKYEGIENGRFIERNTVNYFGPTRLGVNFYYRFDIEGKKGAKRK
ncbi:MAG: DUF3575 domain-containing protein [Alistipes sp.]|nr:DUF3575 domain-containing protein [Alistipes sp.]